MTKLTPEQIADSVAAYKAWLENKTDVKLQTWTDGQWCDFGKTPYWDWDKWGSIVRLKPTPKLRPWKPEEIPVGAVIRKKATSSRHVIDSTWQGFAHFNACNYDAIVLLEDYEWHWPHETKWLPCGVMEDAS